MSGDNMSRPPRHRDLSLSRETTMHDDSDHEFISDEEVLTEYPLLSTTTDCNVQEAKTVETVKILIAMLYTVKNHLRTEWGVALSPGTSLSRDGQETIRSEYQDLLPPGLKGYEHRGLGLTLELATFIEKFISIGVKKQVVSTRVDLLTTDIFQILVPQRSIRRDDKPS